VKIKHVRADAAAYLAVVSGSYCKAASTSLVEHVTSSMCLCVKLCTAQSEYAATLNTGKLLLCAVEYLLTNTYWVMVYLSSSQIKELLCVCAAHYLLPNTYWVMV
jgi:hypothetical protein